MCHRLLSILCVAVVAGAIAPAAGAQEPVLTPRQRQETRAQVSRLWAFVDRRAAELDPKWRPSVGAYVGAESKFGTRLIASMVMVHALAALSGHTGPARHDDRIAPMVRILTHWPAFVETAKRPPGAGSHWHAPGFNADAVDPRQANQHVSLDPQIAEALEFAHRAKSIIGLSDEQDRELTRAVTLTARSPFFAWPALKQNQFNWHADMELADQVVSGDARLLRTDFRRYLTRFLDGIHRAGPNHTTNLNDGLGFIYLPTRPPSQPGNRTSTSEYGNLVFHALDDYEPALAAGMAPLSSRQLILLRSWGRRLLMGEWTHAGYLNWDTGLNYERWHLARYWAFALGGLTTLAEAPILSEEERTWARAMIDQALRFYERYQGDEPGGRYPSTLFGVFNSEDHSDDPDFVPARIAGIIAQQAYDRADELPAVEPPALYAYDPDSRRLAVTTPAYSTATVDQTFKLGYGGADLARLYDGAGRPLGSIGSHDTPGFGVQIDARTGRRLLETQAGRRTADSFTIGRSTPKRGRVPASGLRLDALVDGSSGTRAALRRTFRAGDIRTTYTLRAPAGSVARLRLPVWARYAQADPPSVDVGAGGRLTVTVRQPSGGYRATITSSTALTTAWRPVTTLPKSSPFSRGVLDVRAAMPHGSTTLAVVLTPAVG